MTEGVVDVARRERTDLAAWACLRKVLWNMMDEGYFKDEEGIWSSERGQMQAV
jgi:hypothetical protein